MKLKTISLLLVVAVALTVAGCKKGPDKLIAKTWKVTSVMTKGTISDSLFQVLKADLMKAEMSFKDNKYTMKVDGNVIESGTYSVADGKVVVKTEQGMNMDAVVTKESLTLDTPDFMTSLQPK
ncbi:MAG: hypothetical protein QUS12_14340 [Methanosarcina sp.]|nr:hypothetical protein [Methanosarcina sp.]